MNLVQTEFRSRPNAAQLPRAAFGFALAALLMALFTSAMGAAETKATTAPPLRVGVSPVFPPMVFKQGKELVGVEIDLARALGDKLGRKVVFVELDWTAQTEALTGGKIDIIMSSMSVTMARKSVMNFTRPYLNVGQMALVRREQRYAHSLGWNITPNTKIAVIKGTTGDFLVQREFPKAKRKTYANGADAADALKRGRADLFIGDSTLVWHLAGTYSAEGLTAIPSLLSEEALAWAVRRGDDELLGAANQLIDAAVQDGTMARIFRRWMAVE